MMLKEFKIFRKMEYFSPVLLEFQKVAEISSRDVCKLMRTKGGDGNKYKFFYVLIILGVRTFSI